MRCPRCGAELSLGLQFAPRTHDAEAQARWADAETRAQLREARHDDDNDYEW
jgi:hypothetical protein